MNLRCNRSDCREPLTRKAFVTTCSHVFCSAHACEALHSRDVKVCPACKTMFEGDWEMMRVNLAPDEDCLSMLLTGLRPDIIFDCAQRAMSFWGYQVSMDNRFLNVKLSEQQKTEQSIKSQHKKEIDKYLGERCYFQKKNQELNLLLEDMASKLAAKEQELAVMEQKLCQLQAETGKRKVKQVRTNYF